MKKDTVLDLGIPKIVIKLQGKIDNELACSCKGLIESHSGSLALDSPTQTDRNVTLLQYTLL